MGLFDKLFGGKKSNKGKAKKAPQNDYFLSNSADFGFGNIKVKVSGKLRVDGIRVIATFEELAKERELSFEFGAMYTTLLEEGALTVPVVIRIEEKRYSLYFIYNKEDLLKYKDLVKHVGRSKFPNLIYFSTIPINQGIGTKPIVAPFQLADLRQEKNTRLTGKFAMWWKSDSENTFHDSKTFEQLNKFYEIIKGYETYLAGYVLKQTKIQGKAPMLRMSLPETNISYVLHAPEGKRILLDISQEKGIRFLFPIANTSRVYRERFLKGVLTEIAQLKKTLQLKHAAVDELLDPNAYDWFTFMASMIKAKELEGAEIELVGGVAF